MMTYKKISSLTCLVALELILLYVFAVYWQAGWILKSCVWALPIGIFYCFGRIRQTQKKEHIHETVWERIVSELDQNKNFGRYTIRLHDSVGKNRGMVEKIDETVCINIANPENLYTVVSNLLEHSVHRQVSLSLELLLSPAENTNIAATLRVWLRNILFLQKKAGIAIPVHWLIQTPVTFFSDAKKNPSVFTLRRKAECGRANIIDFFEELKNSLSIRFLKDGDTQHNGQYIQWIEMLNFVGGQISQSADRGWEYIDIHSLTIMEGGDFQDKSEWSAYLAKNTHGLIRSFQNPLHVFFENTSYEYPDKYAVYHKNHISDLIFKVLSVSIFGIFLAALFSTVNNGRLIKQINGHIADFRAEADQVVRNQKIELLKQDLKLLEGYRDNGIPAHLGLGLYRGQVYIPQLKALIPTDLPPKPAKPIPSRKPEPVVITLDSLALFETGQFELKNNANKALIGALKAIESRTDTRILIEGHTDNVGNPVSNRKLSEKRAQSVKDWLVISSNVPESRFEIQGLGDTKPVADNRFEDGRAKNRRVEIILLPFPNSKPQ